MAHLKLFLKLAEPGQMVDREYLVANYGEWAVTTLERQHAAARRDDSEVVEGQVLGVEYDPELPSAQGDTP